ncbi:MAG: 30S ribosomal protein S15 [Candidatus Methanoliparum thermophilum]|uniref:Small ribosomal subunit protein uS15 n=1 Tax=Methanoliparum thermophilum TaxID=2491083 RepID=A0A520KTB7_METT2|nr:MAG: 30S ribosomal protein S15 [Candidatus Methanoliparum thermophilum]
MARMYARRKGSAGSTHPYRTSAPEWSLRDKEEIKEIILNLASKGLSTSEIGMILRDSYGVPSTKLILNKKIKKVLKEENKAPNIPEDLENLIKKAIRLKKHLDANEKDLHNRRALQLTESKIRRLMRYYKREKVLPETWVYDREKAEMMVSK